jgi:hypothetical protein
LRDPFLARFTPDSSMFFKRPPEELNEQNSKNKKQKNRRKENDELNL